MNDLPLDANPPRGSDAPTADWQQRVVSRSLRGATSRSIDRGAALVRAATALLERSGGDSITVQEVADEAGQSLRTLYQHFESKDDLLLAVFEEAMRAYARLVRTAIARLDDPAERLAGALITMGRLPEHSAAGVNRGLVRLELKLTEVAPELVAGSRAPMVRLVQELVDEARDAGATDVTDSEATTFLLMALNTSSTTTTTLGSDVGVRAPAVEQIAGFCLRGLGVVLADGWYDSIGARLRLPERTYSPGGTEPDP